MSRGINRERQVRRLLEADGYWTCRAAGSLGDADVIALKPDVPPLMVEVKSTAGGPWEHFGPADRAELLAAAERAGARAVLCWWPPFKEMRFIYPDEWPEARRAA